MIQSNLLLKFKNIKHGFGLPDEIIDSKKVIFGKQIHGKKISVVNNKDINLIDDTDGLLTYKKNIIIGIKTADCLPVLIFDNSKKIAAAVHCGWKGLKAGILKEVIKKMIKNGSRTKDIITVIGPHIRAECYKVEKDRADLFPDGKIFKENKWFIDLERIALKQLADLGLTSTNIEVLPICTYCNSNNLPSFRRQKDLKSKLISFIGMLN